MKFKEVLKSAKSGKLHKLLRFILITTFIYLFILSGREIWNFYSKNFSLKGIKIDYHDGNLLFHVDSFKYKNPNFSLSASNVEGDLNLWKSLKRRLLYFNELRIEKISYTGKGERKKTKETQLFLSIYLKKLQMDKLSVVKKDFKLYLRKLSYDKESFYLEKVYGKHQGKIFLLKEVRGKVKNSIILAPKVWFKYGQILAEGNVEISKDFSYFSFVGKVKSEDWSFEGKGVKKKERFKVSGNFLYKELKTPINLEVEGIAKSFKNLKITEGTLNYQKLQVKLKGKLLPILALRGKFKGSLFYKDTELKGISGNFNIKGYLKFPSFSAKGKVERFKKGEFKLINSTFSLDGNYNSFNLKLISTNLRLKLVKREDKEEGKVLFKGFEISSFIPLHDKWIPKVVLSGTLNFKKRGESISYLGDFKVDKFIFENYISAGKVKIEGNQKNLTYKLLLSRNSTLTSLGKINFKKLSFSVNLSGKNLPTDSFSILSKAGISGKVDFNGKIEGNPQNFKGNFTFKSRNFSYCGGKIGKVSGKLLITNEGLKISASSNDGRLKLSTLEIKFSPFHLKLLGDAKAFSLEHLSRILTFYHVSLPFRMSGTVRGNYSILYSKGRLKVEARVGNSKGTIAFPEFNLAFSDLFGNFSYFGSLLVKFYGKLNKLNTEKISLQRGKIKVSINRNLLNFKIINSEVTQPFIQSSKISIEGNYNLASRETWGKFEGKGKVEKKKIILKGRIRGDFKGKEKNLNIKFSGNIKTESPLMESPISAKVKGKYLLGKEKGKIYITSPNLSTTIEINKNTFHATGNFRKIKLKSELAKLNLSFGTFSFSYPKLKGFLYIPTFKVRPKSFYELFSVSGMYVTFEKEKPRIFGTKLSYIDGWIEVKEVKLEKEKVKGILEGRVGVKGLIFLTEAKKLFKYVKGKLKVKGEFSYGKEFNYNLKVVGEKVSAKGMLMLENLKFSKLNGEIQNGKVKEIKGEASTGRGSLLIKGKENFINLYLTQITLGKVPVWKANISGKIGINIDKKTVEGTLTLSRSKIKVEKGKKNKEAELKLPFRVKLLLSFSEPLKVCSELFTLKSLPNLTLRTKEGRIKIGGTFFITDGKIRYMGKIFKVVYGNGVIKDLEKNEGKLFLLANSYVSGYYIYMQIVGDFKNPKLILSSDPPLTKEEILNLIMTGASPEEIEKAQELFPAVQVAYYATSSLFKPFELKLQKELKLEKFSIEPYITRYGETVIKLTAGKRLLKNLEISGYETTGQNPEYGGSLKLYLNDKYYLETKYNNYYGLETGIGFHLKVEGNESK